MIDDIADNYGNILTYRNFVENNADVCINPLIYIRMCKAIPRTWRRKLLGSRCLAVAERMEEPQLIINGKEVSINKLRPSFFYAMLVPYSIPTAQIRWEADGVNFGDRWSKVYQRPFQITASTKLQSLQYKVTHRFFPTRRFLCIRGVVDDPFCDNCGDVESIEHYFFLCEQVKEFWKELENTLNKKLTGMNRLNIQCYDALFGAENCSEVINFIILLAKQFIVQQHYQDMPICYRAFLPMLMRNFDMEKMMARSEAAKEKFAIDGHRTSP